jgi:flavin reductase (DIM6/NTAB) family NADH-FMN oxidoreductase RutF
MTVTSQTFIQGMRQLAAGVTLITAQHEGHVLASHQQHLAEAFAGARGIYGERRFDLAAWSTLTTGSPVLAPCLATFDCRLVEAVPAATHSIFIGRVEAVALELDLQPLVYAGGDYGLIASLLNTAEG